MARRPGRPAATSSESALEVAVGLDPSRLTIAGLAEAMGVSRSTLYGYFTGDEDLVTRVIVRSWAGLNWPRAADFEHWRDYLEAVVWCIWDHVQSHPGLAEAMARLRRDASPLIPIDPAMVSALLDFGVPADTALLALDVLSDLTSQTFFLDRAMDVPRDEATLSRRAERMSGYAGSLPAAARAPFLGMVAGSPREHFGRKLRVVLDGIAAAQ